MRSATAGMSFSIDLNSRWAITITVSGVVATTVAVRRSVSSSPISPKKSPGPSTLSVSPSLRTSAVPSSIRKNSCAKLPCVASSSPSGTVSSSVHCATCSSSFFESVEKSATCSSRFASTRDDLAKRGAEVLVTAAAAAPASREKYGQEDEEGEQEGYPIPGHTGDTAKRPRRIGRAQWAAVFSPSVENLVAQLTRLPGIGSRTAQRLAFHILQRPKDEALALASALAEVKERVRFCRECGNLTEEELCGICLDQRRDHALICVVEQPVDVVSLERTHEFRGLYHVLGGSLSPLDGVDPGDLRIDELFHRVEANGVQEVVLATNPNMTGEATAAFLADRLRGRVRVTRLASGLPVGGDLEYADEVTLGRALSGRREM